MTDPPKFFHRRSTRLKGYDYSSPGAYFVTICAHQMKSIFGDIYNAKVHLNEIGSFADEYWKKVLAHFNKIKIDAHVVMPNHVHAIISFVEKGNEADSSTRKRVGLGQVVAFYKYQTTKHLKFAHKLRNDRIWQRNYYDHIIRNNEELNAFRKYILENPLKWELDEYFAGDG